MDASGSDFSGTVSRKKKISLDEKPFERMLPSRGWPAGLRCLSGPATHWALRQRVTRCCRGGTGDQVLPSPASGLGWNQRPHLFVGLEQEIGRKPLLGGQRGRVVRQPFPFWLIALARSLIMRSVGTVRPLLLALLSVLAATAGLEARDQCSAPVVIPGVRGNATTSKFGDGYITRTSDGTTYNTSKFGSGWITRSSDGKSYTTTKFGDGAITRGNGQQVTTSRFGSGTISRSSDGTTTTTQKFGDGSISRSTGGASVTSSKFGSGYISRESGSAKEKGVVRVIPSGKRE